MYGYPRWDVCTQWQDLQSEPTTPPFLLWDQRAIETACSRGPRPLSNQPFCESITCDAMRCFFVLRVEPLSENVPPGDQKVGSFILLGNIRETESHGMDS